MAQAKGSSAQLLLYKETAYKTPPGTIQAVVLPFGSESLKGKRSLNDSEVMRGDRNAGPPDYGNQDAGGSIDLWLDVRAIGYILQGVIGPPASVQDAAKAIDNGSDAVNVGGGVVGIPVTSHGFQAGETVTIAGTVNYNGTYTVLPSSTANQVNITKAYVAETFGSDDTIRASRYTHTFKVHATDSLYSYGIEKGFKDIGQYLLYDGCKFNKLSFDIGGDKSEIKVSLDVLGSTETGPTGTSVDSTPTALKFEKFGNFEASIYEGGLLAGFVRKASVTIDNKLDGDTFVIGSGGVRGSINEGNCAPSGSIEAMFLDGTLYQKAVQGTESSIEIKFAKGVHSLSFKFNEIIYEREAPSVDNAGGIWLNCPWRAYTSDHADQSCVVAVLVNDVPSYAW